MDRIQMVSDFGGGMGAVALHWHGVPALATAATMLAQIRAMGPVQVQRVLVPELLAGLDCKVLRRLTRAGAEVVGWTGAPRAVALASALHMLVVDDLARHPALATVVLVGAPAALVARVSSVVRATGRRCVRLNGVAVLADRLGLAAQ